MILKSCVANLTDSEYRQYRHDMDKLRNQESTLWSAEMKGEERGIKKEKISIAANLKSMGLSVAQIAQATGLSVDEITAL